MRVSQALAMFVTISLIGVACSDDTTGIPSDVEIFKATLNGANEVPALPTPTNATGQATVTVMGNLVSWRVEVSNINNVTLGHIHLGNAETPGPVRKNLFPTTGSFTTLTTIALGSDTVSAGMLDSLRAGNTYVNIHTNDNTPPTNTGPGDYPGGEIRGQLRKL